MKPTDEGPKSICLNVLTLDGGGIRGISSVLILEELMAKINAIVEKESNPPYEKLKPYEIFELIAGTSTGGLIAIMLGKLGMSPEDCAEAYRELSRKIFGKKHFVGRITAGLAKPKYSGERLRKYVQALVQKEHQSKNPDLTFHHPEGADKTSCAVVCREHNDSASSPYKPGSVCICSKTCDEELKCFVHQAARATTAALTFFPAEQIGDRLFADGGIGYNNPTEEIEYHYRESYRVAVSKRSGSSIATKTDNPVSAHGGLNLSCVRIVNLGTGKEPEIPLPHHQGFIGRRLRYPLLALKKEATDSEKVVERMRTKIGPSDGNFKYERFNEDNGICYIEMDNYKELPKIELMTREYLASPTVQGELDRVAKEITDDYLKSRSPRSQPETLSVVVPAEVPRSLRSEATEGTTASTGFNRRDSGNSTSMDLPSKPFNNPAISTPAVPGQATKRRRLFARWRPVLAS